MLDDALRRPALGWAVTDPNNAERVADAVDGSCAAVAARRRVQLIDGDFQP